MQSKIIDSHSDTKLISVAQNIVLCSYFDALMHFIVPPPKLQEFLNDYGMVWVGDSDSNERHLKHNSSDHKSMVTI